MTTRVPLASRDASTGSSSFSDRNGPVLDAEDWEWTVAYELGPNGPKIVEINGKFVEPYNPVMGTSSYSSSTMPTTYLFKTSELLTVTHILYSKAQHREKALAEVTLTERFPYRSPSGTSHQVNHLKSIFTVA